MTSSPAGSVLTEARLPELPRLGDRPVRYVWFARLPTLYGIIPADLLVTLALLGAYRAHWSEAILDEAARNVLANRPDLSQAGVVRRFELMNTALDDAEVAPPAPALVDDMTNDVDDRHVLATAVTIAADVIVTENLRHFPTAACAPHGIIAMSLDDFTAEIHDHQADTVAAAVDEMARRRTRPPTTNDELLTILDRYIPTTVERFRNR